MGYIDFGDMELSARSRMLESVTNIKNRHQLFMCRHTRCTSHPIQSHYSELNDKLTVEISFCVSSIRF